MNEGEAFSNDDMIRLGTYLQLVSVGIKSAVNISHDVAYQLQRLGYGSFDDYNNDYFA